MESLRFNYYEILEVSPYCAQHEVTAAFERAKATYSGENPAIYTIFTESEAREMMKLVDEAYSVLGNNTLRALYDEKMGGGRASSHDLSLEALQLESKSVFKEFHKKKPNFKIDYKRDEIFEGEIQSVNDWSGVWLKKVREYKRVSIELLSEITKINPYYIQGLESMDPDQLPASVFVRGYVLQVAKVLGLNEKLVCESYMKLYKTKCA